MTYDDFIAELNAIADSNIQIEVEQPKKIKYADIIAELRRRMVSIGLDGYDFADRVAEVITGKEKRGIYLAGNVGSGKTERAKFLQSTLFCQMLTAQQIVDLYQYENAWKQLFQWRNIVSAPHGNDIIVDDLGTESTQVNIFGKIVDPMALFIQGRYSAGMRVHFTTNLNSNEIKARYGERVHSRLFEMCRPIELFHADRRKAVEK